MKKSILYIMLAALGGAVKAQEVQQDKVPAPVIQSFNKMYPGVAASEWQIADGNYEADFKKDNQKLVAVYSPGGKHVQTEVELKSVSELPKEVTAMLNKDFAGYKLDHPEKIQTAEGKTEYEVDAEKGKEEYELLFDHMGMLKKRTLITKSEEKKEAK